MQKSIPPMAVAIIIVVVVAVIGIIGYKTMVAPPPPVHGMMNGHPMTDADVRKMAEQMSGGRAHIPPKTGQ